MAGHIRLQIRDAILTAVTGLTTTGANVFTNVVYDVSRVSVPSLLVNVRTELSQSVAFGVGRGGVKLERNCEFDIKIVVEDNEDADASLINIAKEVEEALATATGPWNDLYLIGSNPELAAAEKVRGTLTLRYRALYYTRRESPDQAA